MRRCGSNSSLLPWMVLLVFGVALTWRAGAPGLARGRAISERSVSTVTAKSCSPCPSAIAASRLASTRSMIGS